MTQRMIARRRFLQFAGAAVAAPSLPRIAAAQAYPSRPITMIVPYPAGGPTDTVGRTVAERMRAELGQPIVLENVSGAAGSIGLGRVARAAPDGYTIEVGNWSAHVVNGAIYTLPYDLKTDFEPIILCARAPEVVLSRKTIPATDLKGLIAWAKEHSGKYTIGHSGAGSAPHVAALQFLKLTGTDAQLVPYRGSAPSIQDLVAGQIDIVITDPTSSVPQIRAGNIKGYAITAAKRIDAASEFPTVDEAGLPGFYVATWNGLLAPKGTPKTIIAQLNAAGKIALADAAVRKLLIDLGQELPPLEEQTPESFNALLQADIEKWWPIIKAANIKAD
jgi:tripartite-type tricarboxylate transporter receptor subunit TctC